VLPARRWRVPAVTALLVGVSGLLPSCSSDATIDEVWVLDDGRTLDVVVNTCNADVDIDVESSPDSIVVRATNDDVNLFGTGDDCQDVVRFQLDEEVGHRTIVDGDGTELTVITAPPVPSD
jgi:type IV pilus biogenesis protein CpaD/CtpE